MLQVLGGGGGFSIENMILMALMISLGLWMYNSWFA